MIEITGCDMREFVKAAYDLSSPQGMGIIHYREGGLTDAEVDEIIERGVKFGVSMDYVNGRSIKMHVRKDGDKLFIQDDWYDHSAYDLEDLLKRIGVAVPSELVKKTA